MTSAPRSMRSPRSISGAGRMTSRTLVWSSTSNDATMDSRPMVPRTTSPRTTSNGTGSCRRSTSSTSASVSSGSHSAPSGEAMLSSSGMDGVPAHQREIGKLARSHHPDDGLILMRDDGETAFVVRHQCDHLAEALMLVDEQRRRVEHVPRLHVRGRRAHRKVAAGHDDVTGDQMVDDVFL